MAAYATFSDVEARAGRYAGLFSVAGKQPDEGTLTALLADVSAEIDSAISARGFDPATLVEGAKASLKDVTAYGALARALASVPGDDGLDELRDYAQAVWLAGLLGITNGTHVAIVELEAAGGTERAGDFWTEEPEYGSPSAALSERETLTASLAPTFAKDQTL